MTTHIAGEVVRALGRVVQRCAWCGEALVNDTELSLQANPPAAVDGAEVPPTWPLWPPGAMVTLDSWDRASLFVDDGRPELPEDTCIVE